MWGRGEERRPEENGHLPEVAFLTWEAEMTIDSPWREVTFGINFRFSRSSWWQATTWYRRTWDIRPCRSQSLICNGRSEGSCRSQEPLLPRSLSLSCTPWAPPLLAPHPGPGKWESGLACAQVRDCSGKRESVALILVLLPFGISGWKGTWGSFGPAFYNTWQGPQVLWDDI